MSTMPLRLCAEAGCPERVPKGRCPKHQKQLYKEQNLRRKDSDSLYGTSRWKNARKRFMMNNPICAECKSTGLITAAQCVDHIRTVQSGADFWDETNWQSLCKPCHSAKTRKDGSRRNKNKTQYFISR